MATVVEFTSPAAEFPLGTVFENLPDATIELERIIPHDTVVIPFFWVRGVDVETSSRPSRPTRASETSGSSTASTTTISCASSGIGDTWGY